MLLVKLKGTAQYKHREKNGHGELKNMEDRASLHVATVFKEKTNGRQERESAQD